MTKCCASRRNPSGAMSHAGSFDRSGAGPEFHVGWRMRRQVELSSTGRTRAASGTRTRPAQHPGIEPGHHNGVRPGDVRITVIL